MQNIESSLVKENIWSELDYEKIINFYPLELFLLWIKRIYLLWYVKARLHDIAKLYIKAKCTK